MLNLLSAPSLNCEGISRRSFLQVGTLAGIGISLPAALAQKDALATEGKSSTEMNCILVWTRGGTSHHDTFDPKPEAPVNIRGEFNSIDTVIPGVHFSEIVPRMARELNRYALLRSWNPQNNVHGIADQWVLSGRPFNPAITFPCYGSVVSQQRGFKTAMPPFVQLGPEGGVNRSNEGGTAGVLGLQHNPFELFADPSASDYAVRDITLPRGVNFGRVERRKSMLSTIDSLRRKGDLQPDAFDALDKHYQTALNMVTSPETQRAFEINSEAPRMRERYGMNRFGQTCLLARRLIQAGVRFVTVTTEKGWDTHQDNFTGLKKKVPDLDHAFPELLIDLEEQGMLDTTLVLWLTDFGRTPKINSASGRDHWASAGFAIMAGAGVPGGAVLGKTDDEGGRPIGDDYLTQDIAATIYAKLGLPHDLIVHSPDGRPLLLNEGRTIREWM